MHLRIEKRHYFAFFLIGLAPLTAQILMVRELLAVFYGNELSLGLMLSAWLLWTALGSWIPGRLSDRVPDKQRLLALTQVLMSILLPLSLVYVRGSKVLWEVPGGEIVDMARMTAITFTGVAPFCVLSGFLFALGCGLHDDIAAGKGRSVGAIFFLEALGAAIGGLVTTLIGFHYLNHMEIALAVSSLLLVSSLSLYQHRPGAVARAVKGAVILLMLISAALFFRAGAIEQSTREWAWGGQQLLQAVDTPYGNLTAVSNQDQTNFYENGLWLFSHPDAQSAEHAVHLALLQHGAPRRVLLVGGGISGSLAEIVKHPAVERVVYVELDSGVIDLVRRLMPEVLDPVLEDSRVRLIHQDGRHYVNTTTETYDVIIVDLPDPTTVQLNRFYTVEFFAETRRILELEGLFAMTLSATDYMIGPTLARLLASVQQTLRQVYAEVVVYPGPTARFFAARQSGVLTTDPAVLVDRIRQRELSLQYVQDYYLLFNYTPEKIRFLAQIIETVDQKRINRDFSPFLYFDTLTRWSSQYTPWLSGLLGCLGRFDLLRLLLLGVGVTGMLAFSSAIVSRASLSNAGLYYACFTAGCTEMTLNVMLIITFQILYGTVYYKIALLISAYMIGLMIGSRYMTRRLGAGRPLRRLIGLQGGLALYGLLLWGVIAVIHRQPALSASWFEPGFPVLLIGAGILGGLHFPLASDIYLTRGHRTGQTAGILYALDLAGASLGALVSVIILLPALGMGKSLIVLAFYNLLAAGWLISDEMAVPAGSR